MYLERLVGTHNFWLLSWHYHCNYGTRLVLHWCIKSQASVTGRTFMNYSACWRSKKALVSTSDVIPLIPRQTGLQLSVPQSQGCLTPCKCWTDTFQPLPVTLVIYLCLLMIDLLPVIVIWLLLDFHSVLCFIVHLIFHPVKYSVLVLECIPGIAIPTTTFIKQVNEHHTSPSLS